MKVNIVNTETRTLIIDKLKKDFKHIKLKNNYSIEFTIVDNKSYKIELIKKRKSIFIKKGLYDENKGFQNLNYNIELLKIYIESNYLLEHFVKVADLDNFNDGEERNYYYAYDKYRTNEYIIEIYDMFSEILSEDISLNLKNYEYDTGDPIYLEFFGNKVRLIIEKYGKKKAKKSSFIYFNLKDINKKEAKKIIKKLDKSI